MARTGAVGETSETRHGRGSPLSLNKLWPIWGDGFRFGQLAKFEAAREDESVTPSW